MLYVVWKQIINITMKYVWYIICKLKIKNVDSGAEHVLKL
jgi:hypothetical protein